MDICRTATATRPISTAPSLHHQVPSSSSARAQAPSYRDWRWRAIDRRGVRHRRGGPQNAPQDAFRRKRSVLWQTYWARKQIQLMKAVTRRHGSRGQPHLSSSAQFSCNASSKHTDNRTVKERGNTGSYFKIRSMIICMAACLDKHGLVP